MKNAAPWWKKTTIYQIYPRSFKDTNADGIGDLPGIIQKLDYIKDLGFETIWISPFFASPQQDWGYDIASYREIAPEYGTMADAERLIDEVHRRGMKVVFDLVLNHTSIQHPWFRESCTSKDNPKSDWYLWRDGRGKKHPPNNWKAMPGGSGWHYHPGRDQWYYASFLPFQPDLNYRNPEVKREMFKNVKFWLDKGVDGYRLDIFHAIYKADHFRNNPFHWSYIPGEDRYGFFTEWKYTVNQPETIELAHEMRGLMDSFEPSRFILGEIFGSDSLIKEYLGDTANGMHAIFLWDLMAFKFNAVFFWDALNHYETWYPPPFTPVLVLGNHDSRRWIDRVNGDVEKAKLIALLQLTARGLPVVYYGEEIGLPEGKISAKDSLDPVGQRFAWAPNWLLSLLNLYVNRDNCRTPMAWDGSNKAGFTDKDAKPWLPLSADPAHVNAAVQKSDPDSLINWYKNLLNYRKATPALQYGNLELLPKESSRNGVLGFIRDSGNQKVAVLINFDSNTQSVKLGAKRIALQTGDAFLRAGEVVLGGLSGIVVCLDDD